MNYTRVTEVLYPFSNLGKIDPTVVKKAADRGTVVHMLCDGIISGVGAFEAKSLLNYCSGEEDREQEKFKIDGFMKSFMQWQEDKSFLEKPERFHCDKYMITGECDAIYQDDDGLVLVDFKCPVSESKTWALQGSAYSYLAKVAGHPISRIEFIKLDRTGKRPKVFVYKEDFGMFLKCLELYRHFFKSGDEPNVLDYL